MIIRNKLFLISSLSVLLAACGGGSSGTSNTSDSQTNSSTTSNSSTSISNVLEKDYPVSENAALPARVEQGFVCIDGGYKSYYVLNFDGNGVASVPSTGESGSYSLGAQIGLDLPTYSSQGYAYQAQYHMTAGAMLVGFSGNLSDGINNYPIACITVRHDFSDKVVSTTSIRCNTYESSSIGSDFSSSTTNTFSLHSDGYSQRVFNSNSYSSDINSSLSLNSADTQHGSYLFDKASGAFVMGYLFVDTSTNEAGLNIFNGITDGSRVLVEIRNGQQRECSFE